MSSTPFPQKAIILAAGLGLRMRPLTDTLPKPLVTVAGKPLIDYALDFTQTGNIQDVVVNASYKAELLAAHLAKRPTPHITVSHEDTPLETGGGIYTALPMLGTQFFSINSDTICISGPEHPFTRLHAAWNDAQMDALLLVQPVERAVGYAGPGDFFLENNTLIRRGQREKAPYVFTGVQLIHKRLFEGCPSLGEPFSLNILYNRGMQANGALTRVRGLAHDGDWLHIGTPQERELAERWLAQHAV